MGAGGRTGTDLARAGQRVALPRKTETGGSFHRRLIHRSKKGGLAVGPTKRGKGTKILALADAHSLPLAVSVESASPHESQLVAGVLGHSFLDTLPERLIGDKAYDSDRLDPGSGRQIRDCDDRSASRKATGTDARLAASATLPQTLAGGAALRLASSLSSARDSLGVPHRKFLRHGPPRMHEDHAEVFVRPEVTKRRKLFEPLLLLTLPAVRSLFVKRPVLS